MNEQIKRRFYKRWWFAFILGIIVGAGGLLAFVFLSLHPQYLSGDYWNNRVYNATHKCLMVGREKETGQGRCISEAAYPTAATTPYFFEMRESDGKGGFVPTELNSQYLSSADTQVDASTGSPQITLYFTAEGAKLMEAITGRNIGKQVAVFSNGKMLMAPIVSQKISGNSLVITGNLTVQQTIDTAKGLNAGVGLAHASTTAQ